MRILGIETSCDECSAAILSGPQDVTVNLVASQVDLHRIYGGVVPEIACRRHLEVINPLIDRALKQAGLSFRDIDAIAVSNAPGLIGALLVGVTVAKTLAFALDIPVYGVNHLAAHIYANSIQFGEFDFPLLALVVSGGHTSIIEMRGHHNFKILGETRDDAAGEAFDKVAKYMRLGYPGGPIIEKLAEKAEGKGLTFPRPMLKSGTFEFSFSGLKTAVINHLRSREGEKTTPAEVCRAFQDAVIDVLVTKTLSAAESTGIDRVLMAGGVAANRSLRNAMKSNLEKKGIRLFVPSPALCTDNAAMVACAAYYMNKAGIKSGFGLDAHATFDLENYSNENQG
ncbi:MAG: tRNA (adenosine(37)-N6)-threonylcarbamoyltransferase complex transferase subunit TsaD [Chloroflexi bacterium]|nr:tRNA (adenosine(37)-N6)-threonylcarbamoyltransferase complex transferase subunit TsaD [Chloroflexota bacterium]